MIPIQIRDTEKAAIDLLKPALESALYEANVDLEIPNEHTGIRGFYEDNLKVNKLAYAAIEEFDLPLLRTWYKYGQYEPYDQIDPKALEVADNTDDAYVPSGLRTDVTQGTIKEYLLSRDLETMFNKDLFDFLVDNYAEWDPKPYTDTYIASTKVIQVIEEINELGAEEIILHSPDLLDRLKQGSIDLRYDLKSIDTFDDELHSHLETYLIGFEDTLKQVDETSELSGDQADLIRESRRVYHEYVWPWAAMQISIDKATGPDESQKDFTRSGEDILDSSLGTYQTHLTGWDTRLDENDLRPTYKTSSDQYTVPDALKEFQKAAFENS